MIKKITQGKSLKHLYKPLWIDSLKGRRELDITIWRFKPKYDYQLK